MSSPAAILVLVSAFGDHRLTYRFGGFRRGTLTLRGRWLVFHAHALRHDLLGVLGVHVLGVFHHRFFAARSLVLDDLVGGEVLLGSQRTAFHHRVRDLAREQADGAQRVIVAGD